jgi:hypothetical protein
MRNIVRSDGFASAALLGLPVMEVLDAGAFVSLAAAVIVAAALIALAWVLPMKESEQILDAYEREQQQPLGVSDA